MKKLLLWNISKAPWHIFLVLTLVAVGARWVFASNASTIPQFQSPVATPAWDGVLVTPTPRLQPTFIPATGPATLTTGLKGYWKLNEATTSNRADSSSAGFNSLSNINGVGWKTGKIGKASDFERNKGAYLKRESYEVAGLNFDHSFTLVGWVKRESIGNYMVLVSKFAYGAGINERAYLLQINSNDKLRLVVSPDGAYNSAYGVTGGSQLSSTSNWYHIAAVFDADGQHLKIYVNGNLDADKSVSYSNVFQTSAPFLLGTKLNNGTAINHFDGLLDDWRAYGRALSQTEIQTLMTQ